MIRKLMNEDRELIKKILMNVEHFREEEIEVALELVDMNLKKESDYLIYVYLSEDTKGVVGYICYGKRPLTFGTYDLYWIVVDPHKQGKGIGSELIKYMEEDLKKKGGNLILIETSGMDEYYNERRFYERNGYKVQTIVKDFYKEGDDLVVYHKYL